LRLDQNRASVTPSDSHPSCQTDRPVGSSGLGTGTISTNVVVRRSTYPVLIDEGDDDPGQQNPLQVKYMGIK
jgi:hypothetical protein